MGFALDVATSHVKIKGIVYHALRKTRRQVSKEPKQTAQLGYVDVVENEPMA
jgi:hypothetical protein